MPLHGRLLLHISCLLSCVYSLPDYYEETRFGFTFIYHSRDALLLTLHGTGCYFQNVDTNVQARLADEAKERIIYHVHVMEAILQDDANILSTTLGDMRSKFEDRLADFHCLDKHFFYIATTLTTPCDDVLPNGQCAVFNATFPGLCHDSNTSHSCQRFCGLCDNNTCEDLTGECGKTAEVCQDDRIATLVCPRFCHVCANLTPSSTPNPVMTSPTASNLTATPTTTTTTQATSQTTRASTTTRPHAANRPGKQCLVCGDLVTQLPCNDMELVLVDMTQCPNSQPYCMNDIIQHGQEISQYKRCVDEATCFSLWYIATSDEPLCLRFDPSTTKDSLTCHLCCYEDGCNVDPNPPESTLFRP